MLVKRSRWWIESGNKEAEVLGKQRCGTFYRASSGDDGESRWLVSKRLVRVLVSTGVFYEKEHAANVKTGALFDEAKVLFDRGVLPFDDGDA
jgi:hypothetical protein